MWPLPKVIFAVYSDLFRPETCKRLNMNISVNVFKPGVKSIVFKVSVSPGGLFNFYLETVDKFFLNWEETAGHYCCDYRVSDVPETEKYRAMKPSEESKQLQWCIYCLQVTKLTTIFRKQKNSTKSKQVRFSAEMKFNSTTKHRINLTHTSFHLANKIKLDVTGKVVPFSVYSAGQNAFLRGSTSSIVRFAWWPVLEG